ncbi:MAG TPA: inositol monophosphatase [Desulfurococcales archaeon]|nr:inositol monophosphatase [Desulfurococcales archaeon]
MSINGKLLWVLEKTVSKACEWLRRVRGESEKLSLIRESSETFRVDLEVEKLILDELSSAGLNALVVSEERGILSIGGEKPDYIILIDPLDGSLNYVTGIPYSSVSIAVADYNPKARLNDLRVGVIGSVFTGDMYIGVRGVGAYVNGIRMVREKRVGGVLIVGYLNDGAYNVMLEFEKSIGLFKFRSLGCASLELMLVAKGKASLFVDLRSKLRVIDIGAAYVILRELGCIVRDGLGNEINPSITVCSRIPSIVVYSDEEAYKKFRFIHNLCRNYIKY